jgi:hypothetical protein
MVILAGSAGNLTALTFSLLVAEGPVPTIAYGNMTKPASHDSTSETCRMQ